MLKYAKIVNEETGLCEVGIGTNTAFYKSIGMTLQEVDISDVDNCWYLTDKCPHKSEEDKQKEEREQLDALTLTAADVERALYYDLGMDYEDLKVLIQEKAPQIDIKGLSIEFRANNFYRGALDKDGNRIIDMIGALLGYNSDDMDYLFKNKKLPSKI